jgi:ribosomal protein S18 acetylase RimI-like enzyme
MKTLIASTRIEPVLRWMVHMDLASVIRISQQPAGLQWDHSDFLAALRSINTVGHVAELGRDVVGFMIYQIRRGHEGWDPDDLDIRAARFTEPEHQRPRALQIDLLNIAVAPELHHQGVGGAMVRRLDQKIQREGGGIRTLVPEGNLAVQLFLRGADFRATEVVRGYFVDEDAYIMEKWSG